MNQRELILNEQYAKSDRIIEIILLSYFVLSFGLSFFYDTQFVSILVGLCSLAMYYSTKITFKTKRVHTYIASLVVGVFMALMIFEMHGMFEMHFAAFIGVIVLITYQNWKVFIPLTLFVVVHHSLFAYIQYLGYSTKDSSLLAIHFTQLNYMDFLTFVFHAALFAIAVVIAGVYAYQQYVATNKTIGYIEDIESTRESQQQTEQRAKEQQALLDSIEEKNKLIEEKNREIDARIKILDKLCIVTETDVKGNVIYVNDKMVDVSQYKSNELIGSNINIIRHPDTKPEVFKNLWNTISKGELFSVSLKNKKKDGSPFYVDSVFAPVLNEQGKPIKYIGVQYENTKQTLEKQVAEGIVGAIDQTNAFIEFDITGKILTANPVFLEAMGYTLDEIIGNHHRMFVDPLYSSTTEYSTFWSEIGRGIPQKGQFKRNGKSGKVVWIQGIYTHVKDDMGNIIKVIKIATDITSQKVKELEIQNATDEVKRVLTALANGDLSQRYAIESKDELKTMGESLNATIDVLISQKNNELNTKKVADEVSRVIKAMSEGDLTQRFSIQIDGELKRIGESLNATLDILTGLISKVVDNSERILTASINMTNASVQLSNGANNQASSVEEISSSIEEMTANIQQNTSNSRMTEKISLAAANDINESKDSVNETVSIMNIIASKISIIGEISRQTNLLALNAAVEAARAGEHGRGFAVVASEVRKLAERSQVAASEINEVTNKSVQIVNKSGKLLQEVVPNIQKTSDLVQEIVASSMEQSSGAEQINNAIQSLNQVVQENASTAQEVSSSASELNQQATELQEAVQFFKI